MGEQEFQTKVLSQLQGLRTDVEKLQRNVHKLQTGVETLQLDVSGLSNYVKAQDYKFEVDQRGSKAMVRMATTIIIPAAAVVVLSSLSPAITALVSAIAHQGS